MIKKQFIVGALILLLLHVSVQPAEAGFGFGFSIASWGPFEIGISPPGALFIGAAALIGDLGFFSGGKRGRYRASADPAEQTEVRIFIESIEVSSDDTLRAEHIRIKYRSLMDEYDRLWLPGGHGYLQLQKNGSFSFEDLPIEGYMHLHYDKTLSVFRPDGDPVLIVKSRPSGSFAVLLKRSEDSHAYFEHLFGVSPMPTTP